MKKLFDAFVGGFRTASASIRMVLVLYVFNLMIAFPFAVMFHAIMTGALGNSILADRLLAGFDATVYFGFLRNASKGLGALTSVLGWTAIFSTVLTSVLDGGILGQLGGGDRRFTLASFLGECGRYFWRYVRLTLIFAPAFLMVFSASMLLLGSIFGAVEGNAVSEVGVFWTQILNLAAALFFAGLVVLISDYARVETAHSDARSIIRASWAAVKFVFRRFFSVVGLQLALLAVSLCVIALYLLAESPLKAATGAGILLLLILQQLTILVRMLIRVATFAGERHLYLASVIDQSDSFPVGLASSISRYPTAQPLPSARPAPAAVPVPSAPPARASLLEPAPLAPPPGPESTPVPRARRKPRPLTTPRSRTRAKGKSQTRPVTRRRPVRRKGKP